jgi:hypothetical protein
MHAYVSCHNFGSLDFGKPKFWLAIILVGQKLVANQSDPKKHHRLFLFRTQILKSHADGGPTNRMDRDPGFFFFF